MAEGSFDGWPTGATREYSLISELEREAQRARNQLFGGNGLTLEQLVSALEKLLMVKDFQSLQTICYQLPRHALTQPELVSALFRFAFLSGNGLEAKQLAERLKEMAPANQADQKLQDLISRIHEAPPPVGQLPPPDLKDYVFDLGDSHYSMKMAFRCHACQSDYLETTGWGIMVLRPSYCPQCLEPSLLSPDFLVGVLKRYHAHDGQKGFRKVDRELNRLVTTWHLKADYPAQGWFDGVNLAEPLMLPILRMLIRAMYLEKYVRSMERRQ